MKTSKINIEAFMYKSVTACTEKVKNFDYRDYPAGRVILNKFNILTGRDS